MQFDDVPVLDGFFLRNHRNETFSYRYGSRRVGRFVYWGREGREEEVIQRYLELMGHDKKVHKGKLRLVLLKAIGEAYLSADFSSEALNRVLQEIPGND